MTWRDDRPTHARGFALLRHLASCGVALCLSCSAFGEVGRIDPSPSTCRANSHLMSRVELYFGGTVGEAAWRQFVARVVTPRFPDGLTALDGFGQWRGPRGLVKERTRLLVIFYRPDSTSDARIEAIRDAYKARFRQRSILRVDSTACVEF